MWKSICVWVVALNVCLALPLNEYDLDVSTPESSITTITGSNVTFSCIYTVPDQTTDPVIELRIDWFKSEENTTPKLIWTHHDAQNRTQGDSELDPRVQGSRGSITSLLDGHSIVIAGVRTRDSGDYFCDVMYRTGEILGNGMSPVITLTITDPPQPVLSLRRKDEPDVDDIREGEEMVLKCSTSTEWTDEEIDITFFNDTQPVNCSSTDEPSLCAISFSRTDNRAHVWWCRASWDGQHFNSTHHLLDVQFPASTVTLTQPFPDAAVNPGSRVSITCETDSANPAAHISWRINGAQLVVADKTFKIMATEREGAYNANISSSSLSFIAGEAHHAHEFDCLVIYHYTMLVSSSTTLIVKDTVNVNIHGYNQSINVGESLDLTCDAAASNLTYQWIFTPYSSTKPQYISNKQNIYVFNTTLEDSGEYSCTASNDVSIGSTAVHVTVTIVSVFSTSTSGSGGSHWYDVITTTPDETLDDTTGDSLNSTEGFNMTTTEPPGGITNLIFGICFGVGQFVLITIAIVRAFYQLIKKSKFQCCRGSSHDDDFHRRRSSAVSASSADKVYPSTSGLDV